MIARQGRDDGQEGAVFVSRRERGRDQRKSLELTMPAGGGMSPRELVRTRTG